MHVRRRLGRGLAPTKQRGEVGGQVPADACDELRLEDAGEHLEHGLGVLSRETEAHTLAPLGLQVESIEADDPRAAAADERTPESSRQSLRESSSVVVIQRTRHGAEGRADGSLGFSDTSQPSARLHHGKELSRFHVQ
jgi:hypothetical protein